MKNTAMKYYATLTAYQMHSIHKLLDICSTKAPLVESEILKQWNVFDLYELPAVHYEEIKETIANHINSK
jgi:hypothetical protein